MRSSDLVAEKSVLMQPRTDLLKFGWTLDVDGSGRSWGAERGQAGRADLRARVDADAGSRLQLRVAAVGHVELYEKRCVLSAVLGVVPLAFWASQLMICSKTENT